MKFLSTNSKCLFIAGFLTLGATHAMFADQAACNAESIQGAYGYSVTGNINAGATPALPPGPFAAVGRIVFNGTGGVSTVRTISANGMIIPNDMGTGTYMIKADCTGTFSISISTPGGVVNLNLNFVVDNANKEIRAIVTNSGYVLLLNGRKQLTY